MESFIIFLMFASVPAALIYWLYCEFTPHKRFYQDPDNPYFYVTREGGFGVDIDRMAKEDPEMFDEKYLKPAREFREYFEARGHTFKNGKIDPPIVIRD